MNDQTASFNENFSRLRQIADTLKSQREPDIDSLVNQVAEATAAYRVCADRLDAVTRLIDEMLATQPEQNPAGAP